MSKTVLRVGYWSEDILRKSNSEGTILQRRFAGKEF
jgi:hypothetical protein